MKVWWRHLPPLDSAWSARHRSIWLRPDLTTAETRSLLAHELGHVYHGDEGPQPDAAECRAWRYAAWLLVDDHQYAAAEAQYGAHIGALSEQLGVTREVVQGFQSLLTR